MPSLSTIIITIFAIAIIIALAFFYYYFTTKSYPVENPSPAVVKIPPVNNPPIIPEPPPRVESFSTEVINFVPPETLPAEIKKGDCQINSVAQPYRPDAWKCAVGKIVYDPCFSTALSDVVYCKMNPLEVGNDFLINLARPLPAPAVPKNINSNWAWFLVLEDGTELSPYVGTRPIMDGEVALYGSKIVNGERTVLIGDLISGPIWTAQKKVLTLSGKKWVTKSSETVRIKTVWQ